MTDTSPDRALHQDEDDQSRVDTTDGRSALVPQSAFGETSTLPRGQTYATFRAAAQRWANRHRHPAGVFVKAHHLAAQRFSRASFRVIAADTKESLDAWILVETVRPEATRETRIARVRREEAVRRAAPWEGVGRRE